MAFNLNPGGNFISFASYSELTARDQRLFEANEGLTSAVCEPLLEQASDRILTKIKQTDWWEQYQFDLDSSLQQDKRLLPDVNVYRIRGSEQNFKDLNIYFALSEYILPRVADFGNPESAELEKIKFYRDQFDSLFKEVIEDGSWYDYDADGTIETLEKAPNKQNRVRSR